MADHLYAYAYSPPSASAPTATFASRSLHRYLDSADPPISSSLYCDALRLSSSASASRLHPSWPSLDLSSPSDSLLPPGIKRPSEALYHQTLLGAHDSIGQTEAWYSTSSLVKRPRLESASNLPIYPQRPGEKDCAHYMLTRTCKFGDSCKFDHPIWVPEGGIPDWKEVPFGATSEPLPERPGEPDCPYFLKTQKCKFGSRCKFNHPKDKSATTGASENADASILPDRPSEPLCAFYMKTGKCKFGSTCKFHHPKDIQVPMAGQEIINDGQNETEAKTLAATKGTKASPALCHNTKGLPIRPGEVDCPFYLKTGSCKYGASCRYNHPDRNAFTPPAAALGHTMVASPVSNLNVRLINPSSSVLSQPLGLASTIYPQRPGQTECDYYMKTGECKFGERCKFHHPIDRSAGAGKAAQPAVKLTLAGLPRREGATHCPYYMKTGACKYGATCKFDHPPPGEVMAMAALGALDEEAKVEQKEAETVEV